MVENPGFIFKIKNNSVQNINNLNNCIKKLPREYGSQVINNENENWQWFYFLPSSQIDLIINIVYDDGENLILFNGSIYNSEFINNPELLKKKLLNLLKPDPILFIHKFINSLSGYFCGIIGNKKHNNFYAFTDNFGVGKLFYFYECGEKIISTNLYLIKEYLGNKADFSNFAASSIIYCGHTFSDQSVINKIKQINPGHFIGFNLNEDKVNITDYMEYPERLDLSLNDSVKLVSESHKSFWHRMNRYVKNDITLLLSRGKDCRVILKHMVDTDLIPNIVTYFRENNNLYPFISFQLDSKDDSLVAEKICLANNLGYNRVKIDNISFLENLKDIILLNNGSPGHWEIFMAALETSSQSNYLVSGFFGDPYAGKGKHHYIFGKTNSKKEYGRFIFNKAADSQSYNIFSEKLNKYGLESLHKVEDLSDIWVNQYNKIKSEDLDIIGAEGLLRTRGIGRVIPTFHQARLYTVPIYPYLDKEIFKSYTSIPGKYLKGEIAHLMQISDDNRFNNYPTTRFKISAKLERRYLKILSILRKIDFAKTKISLLNYKASLNFNLYNISLKKTLKDFNLFSEQFLNDLLPDNKEQPKEYYSTIANYISFLRIKHVFFSDSIPLRKDLRLIEYNISHPIITKYE